MSDVTDLIVETSAGLYCPAGDFHIDPWQPVDRAVITHAHGDHAQPGSRAYLVSTPGAHVLRLRIGSEATIQTIAYGEAANLNGVRVSLHPAGHLLGSSQVRLEYDGQVWVVSGDYKTHLDPTCAPLETLRCDTFITESTFGLPVYRWPPAESVVAEINQWWRENQENRRTSIVFAYALGKAQRILAGIDASIGPILVHGAIARVNEAYAASGVNLPPTMRAHDENVRTFRGSAMVIAPPSSINSPWLRKFGKQSSAAASGWMRVRGNRRRGNVDRGFVLSDHADWDGLLQTIRGTGAARIGVTHGSTEAMIRYLREQGYESRIYRTRFSDKGEEEVPLEIDSGEAASPPES